MNDFAIIFQAEFLRKIRSRPFIIGTLIGAAAIVLLSSLPAIIGKAFSGATKNVVLAGDSALTGQAKELLAKDFDIVATIPKPASPPTLADLDRYSRASMIALLERTPRGLHVTAYARDAGQFRTLFTRDLVPLNVALATHLPEARIKPLLEVPVEIKGLDTKFANESAANTARGVAYILVLLLYMAIIINSQGVMSSVAEEKTSRIAELLVATTSPAALLAGKIVAAGTAGLIQLAVWIGAGLATGAGVVSRFNSPSSTMATDAGGGLGLGAIDISTGEIAALVAFFLIGFMQYASLYAAAASLINRTEDLGSVATPLVIPIVGGFMLAQYALGFPNAPSVAVISQIPLLAPFVMFTRLTVSSVPLWQILLSLAINVLGTVAIIFIAGKIYRVGLLMYGRPPKLSQVLATLRT